MVGYPLQVVQKEFRGKIPGSLEAATAGTGDSRQGIREVVNEHMESDWMYGNQPSSRCFRIGRIGRGFSR